MKCFQYHDASEEFFSKIFGLIPDFNQENSPFVDDTFSNCGIMQSKLLDNDAPPFGGSENQYGPMGALMKKFDLSKYAEALNREGYDIETLKSLNNSHYRHPSWMIDIAQKVAGIDNASDFEKFERAIRSLKQHYIQFMLLESGPSGSHTVMDLNYWIHKKEIMELPLRDYVVLATKILWQIISQIICLQKYGVFFFDIKSPNILVIHDGEYDIRVIMIDTGGFIYHVPTLLGAIEMLELSLIHI